MDGRTIHNSNLVRAAIHPSLPRLIEEREALLRIAAKWAGTKHGETAAKRAQHIGNQIARGIRNHVTAARLTPAQKREAIKFAEATWRPERDHLRRKTYEL